MKNSSRQPVSGKGSKATAKDITVSISQKKAAGAAAGAALGAIAAGPVGALVGGVVGTIVASNSEEVKGGLESAAKAAMKKAPTLRTVEKAVMDAGKKTAAAIKGRGAKVKAALASPPKAKPAKSSPKTSKKAPAATAKPVAGKSVVKASKGPVKGKAASTKKPARRG